MPNQFIDDILDGGVGGQTSGTQNRVINYVGEDFTDLSAVVAPTANNGDVAYVKNSQGTAWLPGPLGGTYYPSGLYVYDGANWVSSRNAIADQLNEIIDDAVTVDDTQTINGQKTFVENIIIDSPLTVPNLEIGWFNDLTPEDPDAYGIRRTDASGYGVWMSNANFPQFVMGDGANVGGFGFIDVSNNRPLAINVLDTGTGTPGQVIIGSGGLNLLTGTGYQINGQPLFTTSWSSAFNSANVNSGKYLRRQNGTSTNLSPYVAPRNMTIKMVTASSNAAQTWIGDVLVDSGAGFVVVHSINVVASSQQIDTGLLIDISAGDRVAMRMTTGTSIDYPNIDVYAITR